MPRPYVDILPKYLDFMPIILKILTLLINAMINAIIFKEINYPKAQKPNQPPLVNFLPLP